MTTTLPNGQQGTMYSTTLAASGGTSPYTWSLSAGSLPAGLSLNASTGQITGMVNAEGTFNFTAQVTDSTTPTPLSKTQALTIVVAAEPTTNPVSITTTTLPSGKQGTSYSSTLAASGGTSPYTWSVSAGSLPTGLSLNASTGQISGTPSAEGTFNFTAQVTDSSAPTPLSKTQALSIVVAAEPTSNPVSITTTSLPNGKQGTAYSTTLAASGGTSPYTWSVVTGTLPTGLSLNTSAGQISGTPSAAGTFNFSVQVTDSTVPTAQSKTLALSIIVAAAPAPTSLSITTTSLPNGQQGTGYSTTLGASGGASPYTWTVTTGSLPTGLSLNASTGQISGTPSAAGTFNFSTQVKDSTAPTAQTKTLALSIVVAAPASSSTGILPSDRAFPWNPGLSSVGGIPSRTTQCASVSPSGQDDSAAIQAALDSCPAGQVVQLSAGTFIVNSRYLQVHSSITLRGAGPGVTILSKTNGATARTNQIVAGTIATGGPLNNHIYVPTDQSPADTQPVVIVGNARWPAPDSTTSQNLTADGVAGSNTITIANASGFTAGQWVLLDEISKWAYVAVPLGYNPSGVEVEAGDHVVFQMHNPTQGVDDPPAAYGWFSRGYPSNTSSSSDTDGRMTSEIKEIASVSGNTITFTTPLSIGYRVSHLAQLTRYTANSNGGNGAAPVTLAGIESLTIRGGSDGGVRFEVATYSWAKNIEVTQWLGEGIAIEHSYKVEIRHSYVHTGSEPTPGGGGYAISLALGSSEVLIEDNISRDTNKVMVARSCGTGSVVAYNYMDDGWISYEPTWQEIGLNASHMAGPHHVLFEGNYGFNMDTDYTHGSSQYMTYFRNYVTGQRGSWTAPDANSRTAGVSSWAKEFTFIGNVMGRSGQMSGWLYSDPMMGCDVNGNNCNGAVAGTWGQTATGNIWQVGYDATNQWTQEAELGALSSVIRDGNYDYLTNSVHWHNTPAGYAIPNSLYLTAKPPFFGNDTWPWVNPTSSTQLNILPAKARYDAGTPFALAPGATQ